MTQRVLLILFMVVGATIFPLLALTTSEDATTQILVFTKTAAFRHDSIPAAIESVKKLASENSFRVEATEDAAVFTKENLSKFAAVVFLNTTGDVLNDEQQTAFEKYIRDGGGFVGIHAAADTEYDWPWYGDLVGARFVSHPAVQQATIKIQNREHPSTKHFSETWQRTDEWYNFRDHPHKRLGDKLVLLASLDESSYQGGSMGDEHPFAWCHEFDGGRAWYTGGGHTPESYAEPDFLKHLLGGIKWAARMKDAEVTAATQPASRPAAAPVKR